MMDDVSANDQLSPLMTGTEAQSSCEDMAHLVRLQEPLVSKTK